MKALKTLFGKVMRLPSVLRKPKSSPGARSAELAFLPAALELMETPPSPLGRAIMWSICAFLAVALAWAAIGKVDMVAIAPGKIVPTGRVKVVQSVEIGTVTAIYVTEGQAVKSGDILVELNPTESGAERERVSTELAEAKADSARIRALLDGKSSFVAPEDVSPAIIERQQSLLASSLAEYNASVGSIEQDVAQKKAEIAGIDDQISKLQKTLPLVKQRAEALRILAEKGYSSKLRLSEAQQVEIETAQDLAIYKSKKSEANSSLLSLQQKQQQAKAQFQEKQFMLLSEAEQKIATLGQEFVKAKERNDRLRLVAPSDGVVQQLAVHTVGGVVTPAQQLMLIVPEGGALEVEAIVENKDIGFISEGQDAEIKIDTFPFTRYGLIHGKILHVSRDAVAPSGMRDNGEATTEQVKSRAQAPTFLAKVSMERSTINVDGKQVNLAPGMTVTAEVKTGKRRVIEYLLSPLLRYKQESLRER